MSKSKETAKKETKTEKTTQKKEVKKVEKDTTLFSYVKKTQRGIYVNGMPVKLFAGKKVDDSTLRYEMRRQGVEFVETLDECEFTRRLG